MEILIALLYLVCIYGVFRWLEKRVRAHFGDYVAEDVFTRIGLVLVSSTVVIISVQALVFVTGQLVTRL